MSTLQAIRTAVKDTLEDNISSFMVYDTVAGVTQVPSAVVVPRSANFSLGMAGGNCVEWMFDLYVLAPYTDPTLGQNSLDGYIDGAGANSIRRTIKLNPTLGLSDVSANVERMTDYGGEYKAAQIQHIGAQLALKVLVTQ